MLSSSVEPAAPNKDQIRRNSRVIRAYLGLFLGEGGCLGVVLGSVSCHMSWGQYKMDTRAISRMDIGFYIGTSEFYCGTIKYLMEDACHFGFPEILIAAHMGGCQNYGPLFGSPIKYGT